jgi:hypothetical protein
MCVYEYMCTCKYLSAAIMGRLMAAVFAMQVGGCVYIR